MATRSNIFIKLRESDRNRDFELPWGETFNPKGAEYVGIYCHWDGYPRV